MQGRNPPCPCYTESCGHGWVPASPRDPGPVSGSPKYRAECRGRRRWRKKNWWAGQHPRRRDARGIRQQVREVEEHIPIEEQLSNDAACGDMGVWVVGRGGCGSTTDNGDRRPWFTIAPCGTLWGHTQSQTQKVQLGGIRNGGKQAWVCMIAGMGVYDT